MRRSWPHQLCCTPRDITLCTYAFCALVPSCLSAALTSLVSSCWWSCITSLALSASLRLLLYFRSLACCSSGRHLDQPASPTVVALAGKANSCRRQQTAPRRRRTTTTTAATRPVYSEVNFPLGPPNKASSCTLWRIRVVFVLYASQPASQLAGLLASRPASLPAQSGPELGARPSLGPGCRL